MDRCGIGIHRVAPQDPAGLRRCAQLVVALRLPAALHLPARVQQAIGQREEHGVAQRGITVHPRRIADLIDAEFLPRGHPVPVFARLPAQGRHRPRGAPQIGLPVGWAAEFLPVFCIQGGYLLDALLRQLLQDFENFFGQCPVFHCHASFSQLLSSGRRARFSHFSGSCRKQRVPVSKKEPTFPRPLGRFQT